MTDVISREEMAALLGRTLTSTEDTNYSLYLKIAVLRLEDLLCTEITFPIRPLDLRLLLARCFGAIVQEQDATADLGVASKKVEDFSISRDGNAKTPVEAFAAQNANLIAKYARCQAKPRSGDVRHGDCIRCI